MAVRQYRFTSTLDEADFVGYMAAFNRYNAYSGGMQKLSRLMFRISGAFMTLTGLLNIVLCVYATFVLGEPATAFEWIRAVCFAAIGVMLWMSQNSSYAGRSLWKRYAHRGEAVTFRFSPGNYKCIAADGEKKYDYSAVTALYQDAAHYYLFRGRREGDILRKDGIDELGLDGFDAFLEEKTGQTLRAVK